MSLHIHIHHEINGYGIEDLASIVAKSIIKELRPLMTQLDQAIADLTVQVQNDTTVIGSAKTLIQSIPQLIQQGIDSATAAGATPEQLQALKNLKDTIISNDNGLANAIAQNTPGAPVAPNPPANP